MKFATSILLLFSASLFAAPRPEQIPLFHIRVRATLLRGAPPIAHSFQVRFAASNTVVHESEWSAWMAFDRQQAVRTVAAYPATYIPAWPIVLHVQVDGIVDATDLEAELKFDENGDSRFLRWRAFGPDLGILVWRESPRQSPQAATMAVYNRRYWSELAKATVRTPIRPQHFVLVDRFIGGDDDRLDWQEGITNLARLGLTALVLPPGKTQRELLAQTGGLKTAWAVYSPPGYAFSSPIPPNKDAESPVDWAAALAKSYLASGFAKTDVAWLAMSDEPGWYYPSQYTMLRDAPALDRFHSYLKANGLLPSDFDQLDWRSVTAIGRSQFEDLPSKRLFYWTQRFFSWDSSRYFAECTSALERAFYPGLLVATNWNFFSGRLYVPGPVANNPDKQSHDAAEGGQDWFEFGRMHGGRALWTEDWFPDSQAYQWSFYAAKLRSAAARGNVTFGGYIVPRASGDRRNGLLQKVLALLGNGAKAMQSYVFGPEYTFPGNCYSEIPHILPQLADAYRMIASAEEVLWPGRVSSAQVAFLAPRSAETWDEADTTPKLIQISDATNTNLNAHTVDYMAELADLYLAFQHANVPVDFIDEDDLKPNILANYRAVYLTEPDIPREGQEGLAAWIRNGGTLVTVSNAGSMDRYHEPCDVLQNLEAAAGNRRQRLLIDDINTLKSAGKVRSSDEQATAWGARDLTADESNTSSARFDDGSPAITRRQIGKGAVVHFSWLPGISYMKSAATMSSRLPSGFSAAIRNWIVAPAEESGVSPPVHASVAMVETPVLVSPAGAAVTLLNWNNEPIPRLILDIHLKFRVHSVRSVKVGHVPFQPTSTGIRVTLSLGAADILVVKP